MNPQPNNGRGGGRRRFPRRNLKANMFSAVSKNGNADTRNRKEGGDAGSRRAPGQLAPRNAHSRRSGGGQRNRRLRLPGRDRMPRPAAPRRKPEAKLPPLAPDSTRIIPLGGVEEVGKNMTALEFGNDIIVMDAGFAFHDDDTPGVDYILPNTAYLEENKDRIRAVFITHGHLDHIGGIPYIMNRIGNPPLYTRSLTTIMIKKRQDEFPHLPPLDIRVVEKESTVRVGSLKVSFFNVTHTIPDAMGIVIETPYGAIVNPGDIKLEHEDGVVSEREEREFGRFKDMNVLLLMMDSTNVDNPGFSTPEKLVHKNLDEIIRSTKNRLIIGTFASQIERMIAIIESAERANKKVVVEGRSMKNNIEIVRQTGMLKVKKETIITAEEMDNYPPDRIIVLATGAQGDEFAALMRMSMKTHKYFKISKRDTVLLSASIIPGNERAVQKLKDNLARQGAKIIHYRTSEVYIHSTGHGNRGELEWIHRHVKPKFFMPMHGTHYMLRVHEDLAKTIGMPEDHIIVPDNGAVLEIQDGGTKFVRLKEAVASGPVMVDGFAIGDVQEVVMRDRKMLAEDGMFVIIASINLKTGKLKKSPDIISRGFVYLRESQELLNHARGIIKKTIEDTTAGMNPINFDFVKSNLSDAVSRYLFQKTAKRPIVIPVVLGV
ncbi:MAG TPA: ribonuclease J [Candidatus Paceibacterota bacterium]|nr:ribonuclease J [Candidatus Paceibacterota bacterium]